MGRRLLFIIFSLLVACENDLITRTECPATCYDENAKTLNVGVCISGTPTCIDGVITSCEGQITPSMEICDGLDNDCDGITDEDVSLGTLTCFDANKKGICMYGTPACNAGKLECIMRSQETEECNTIDDDCDGIVDNVDVTALCYDGDINELAHFVSLCQAGIEVCRNGMIICDGQTLPESEICDGLDNDCNGIIDNLPDALPASDVDVLIIIDQSGSMVDKIESITSSLLEFVSVNERSNYRYAVVLLTPSASIPLPVVTLDFTNDLALVRQAISAFNYGGHGTELSYDAFMSSVDGTLNLTWRNGDSSKALLWYGDEEGQTSNGYTPLDVADALTTHNVVFYGFIAPEHSSSYEPIARLTGGNLYDIRANRATMTLDLVNVTRICEP